MSPEASPLSRQLESWAPRTLLAVGGDAAAMLRDFADSTPECALEILESNIAARTLAAYENAQRYDFALVAGYLEMVDAGTGSAVIARLRDVLARRLCVIVRSDEKKGEPTRWSDAELAAFGLTLLSRFEDEGSKARLYGFDIASYKQTPDWLNPRHWAHPELWGKFRW